MRKKMKKKIYNLTRLSFIMTLSAAALFVTGGKSPTLEKTAAEINREKAAEVLVSGTGANSAQWKNYAASNPMFFIEIEAGNL